MFLANYMQTKKNEENIVENMKMLQIQDEKRDAIGQRLLYYC